MIPAGVSFIGYFTVLSNGGVTASNATVSSSGQSGNAFALASQEFAQGNTGGAPPSTTSGGYFLQSWGISEQESVRVDVYSLANPNVPPPAPPGWTQVNPYALPLPVAIAFAEGATAPLPTGLALVPGTAWRQITTTNGTYGGIIFGNNIIGAYQLPVRPQHLGGGRRVGMGGPPPLALGDQVQVKATALLNAIASAPSNTGTVACNDSTITQPVWNFQTAVTAAFQAGQTAFATAPIDSAVYDAATANALQKAINVYEQIWSTSLISYPQPFPTLTAPPPCLIQATTLPSQGLPPPVQVGTPTPPGTIVFRGPIGPQPFVPGPPNQIQAGQPINIPGQPIIAQPAATAAATPAASSTSTALAGAGALGGLGLLAYYLLG